MCSGSNSPVRPPSQPLRLMFIAMLTYLIVQLFRGTGAAD